MASEKTIERQAEELYQRLVRHAQFVRADRGEGRLHQVDALSGRAQGYYARVLSGEIAHFDLRELLKMVLGLKADPGGFFAEAFGFSAERHLWELERQNRHQVDYLKKRLRWARVSGEEVPVAELRERILALEERRWLAPRDVKHEVLGLSGLLERLEETSEIVELRSEVFRVLGSVSRTEGKLSNAAWCLREALKLGGKLADQGAADRAARCRARALQCVASLVSDVGKSEETATLVLAAQELYRELGDSEGVARTLVDLGSVEGKMGRYGEAVGYFEASLAELPEACWRHRFTALQGLGLCHLKLGQSEKARGYLDEAIRVSRQSGSEATASWSLWLRAKIRSRTGDLEGAERDFRRIRQIQLGASGSAVDLALVSLELARVLWQSGKSEELHQLVAEMMRLLGRLERSPLMLAAVEKLVLDMRRGELTREAIETAAGTARKSARGKSCLSEPEALFSQPLGSGQGPVR